MYFYSYKYFLPGQRRSLTRFLTLACMICLVVAHWCPYSSVQAQTITSFSPDTSFYHVGYTIQDFSAQPEVPPKVLPLENGSMLVFLQIGSGQTLDNRLYQMNPDGTWNQGFNNGQGYFSCNTLTVSPVTDLIVTYEGKILLLFLVNNSSSLIARLNQDGTFDASYAVHGTLSTQLSEDLRITSMAMTSDTSIYVGGIYRYDGTRFNTVVMKLKPNGELDSSFGGQASTVGNQIAGTPGLAFLPHIQEVTEETSVKMLSNQNELILLGNNDYPPGTGIRSYMSIAYSPDKMEKDTSYNHRGEMYFNIGDNGNGDWISTATLDNQGNVIAACLNRNNHANVITLAKITVHGILDKTFNGTGTWVFNLPSQSSNIGKVAVDKQGKIWVAGNVTNLDGQMTGCLLRLRPNGTLDSSFNKTGVYYLDTIPSSSVNYFILSDNMITVFGTAHNDVTNTQTFIARFRLDNSLPPTLLPSSFPPSELSCSHQGNLLSVKSNSTGQIHLELQSGPATLLHDTLYVQGKGTIFLHFQQDATSSYDALDTTFRITASCPLTVYEYITPNNDGHNDKFFIENIEFYPQNTVSILTKWQQEIYTAHNYQNSWQPSHLQEGSYYYIVNAGSANETYKGVLLVEKK